MDRELLIEIGCEEIPASWLPGLTAQIARHLDAGATSVFLQAFTMGQVVDDVTPAQADEQQLQALIATFVDSVLLSR